MRVSGAVELQDALKAMGARVQAATPLALGVAASLVEGRARAQLSRYSHQRGTVTPAPPGGPPALVTGVLRSSFELLGPTEAGAASWRAVLGPTAPYARVQELGGDTGRGHRTRLPARPYLRPSAESMVRDRAFLDVFARAWGRAVTG